MDDVGALLRLLLVGGTDCPQLCRPTLLGTQPPTLHGHLLPQEQLSPHWQLPPVLAPQLLQHACAPADKQAEGQRVSWGVATG